MTRWRFAVDRGGTFTDLIALSPEGQLHTCKLLSVSPLYEDAVAEGMTRILGGPPTPETVASLRVGTTVATNVLLERKGQPVALCITEGLRDLIEIGDQTRPDIFALVIEKPKVLYDAVICAKERIGSNGEVVLSLDENDLAEKLATLRNQGFDSVAIVFAHAWNNPRHELAALSLAEAAGFSQISLSHKVSNRVNMTARGQTTLVDAYLSPVLNRYVKTLHKRTAGVSALFMQNTGGLTQGEGFSGKDAVLSGPAGGVMGMAAVAKACGLSRAVGFDMGGTSTDVSRFDGSVDTVTETQIAGVKFQTPMVQVNTVAAGGGSRIWFDGGKLRVGPDSAGADPGPACYGNGGPATITDANLVLGRIWAELFPRSFGPNRDQPLDYIAAKIALADLAENIRKATGRKMTIEETALGAVRIAAEIMCRPIKSLTLAKGKDVADHALICFGGAAGQHGCDIAEALGIGTVVLPPFASLLSAYGIADADQVRMAGKSMLRIFSENLIDEIKDELNALAAPPIDELSRLGIDMSDIRRDDFVELRPLGADETITLPFDSGQDLLRRFQERYYKIFGFSHRDTELEIAAVSVRVSGRAGFLPQKPGTHSPASNASLPEGHVRTVFASGSADTPVYRRDSLQPGTEYTGPALIVEDDTTCLVAPGWMVAIHESGSLILTSRRPALKSMGTTCDPVTLEVFHQLFMGIADQMGVTLAKTAHSANIRERRDFSCAIFDPAGALVANAHHIPVHLGAMGDTVRALIADKGRAWNRGDVYATNNPFNGGSHLPDITVISPIFDENGKLMFIVANRGHHADIGGIVPGSMPAKSTRLEEEGVVLDGFRLVAGGHLDEPSLLALLGSGPYPARNPKERLSDLRAQIAANRTGEDELRELVARYGLPVVQSYMRHIRDNAATTMENALSDYLAGREKVEGFFEDRLDTGAKIAVRITIEKKTQGPRALVDFTGTDSHQPDNLNAPPSVSRAAVLYVFRSLIRREIPLNEGCLAPIELILPKDSMLNPPQGSAVVGGNVETSQRVVDCLYGALGVAAASQGTMNNLTFGKADRSGKQYYETIAGGSGAVEGSNGADAVQVHMTNTRITDPEVLEQRFPEVRVERFEIRRGSGGWGRFRGGDGVVRRIRFLQARQVSILSERRSTAPFGMQGGQSGAPGVNLHIDDAGNQRPLPAKVTIDLLPGQAIEIQTPGGGGWGKITEA